ncbi:MAG: sigma-70 family RNA polymerase sigma factor [Actinomycetota bacterium]
MTDRPRRRPRRAVRAEATERVADLYEAYAPDIGAYARRRSEAADAADVVAETFLVAWRRHDHIPPEPRTLPWLYGVARRVLANQRRASRRRGHLHERLANEFREYESRTIRIEQSDHVRRVAAALDSLSANDAEILRLASWEALTPSEIATTLEIDAGTARQRLHRARARLRRRLDEDGLDQLETASTRSAPLRSRRTGPTPDPTRAAPWLPPRSAEAGP